MQAESLSFRAKKKTPRKQKLRKQSRNLNKHPPPRALGPGQKPKLTSKANIVGGQICKLTPKGQLYGGQLLQRPSAWGMLLKIQEHTCLYLSPFTNREKRHGPRNGCMLMRGAHVQNQMPIITVFQSTALNFFLVRSPHTLPIFHWSFYGGKGKGS